MMRKSMEKIEKTIDIQKAIRNSDSGFFRSMPRILIRLIEKLIHQDEMNASIHRSREKTGVPFVNAILEGWNVEVIVKGGENVPETGKFVFVANHPVGGIDALSFLSAIYRFFPNVISPSNQLFNYIPNLHPVILGVNVFGANTKETAEKINQLFLSDAQVMIFPAGEVSRKINGKISDPAWQKTFITKAVQFQRDVIPVFISGRNSRLFYFVARFRKALGIKMYVETVLLPREMMLQRNSSISLSFGKPIPWQSFTTEKNQNQWAQDVKEKVYQLAES
ncbi:MAG: 1-acyl-sn-glycerol-3-phosphate acyltransferase [Bacteroidales bacterium]|nr:1-acyl-sn-glycerol-3-phosphate acyltransferase [Bacteroidales bacterium]